MIYSASEHFTVSPKIGVFGLWGGGGVGINFIVFSKPLSSCTAHIFQGWINE